MGSSRRRMMESEIYHPISYIENDGTSASITRLNSTNGKTYNNSGFDIEFETTTAFDTNTHVVFGARRANGDCDFGIYTNTAADAPGNGQIHTESSSAVAYLTTGKNVCSLRTDQYTVNGDTYTVTRGTNGWNYSIAIFGCREISSNKYASHCKIYSFKLYRGSELKIDLHPCIRNSDGAYGFYDTVDNNFYTNSHWTGG